MIRFDRLLGASISRNNREQLTHEPKAFASRPEPRYTPIYDMATACGDSAVPFVP